MANHTKDKIENDTYVCENVRTLCVIQILFEHDSLVIHDKKAALTVEAS